MRSFAYQYCRHKYIKKNCCASHKVYCLRGRRGRRARQRLLQQVPSSEVATRSRRYWSDYYPRGHATSTIAELTNATFLNKKKEEKKTSAFSEIITRLLVLYFIKCDDVESCDIYTYSPIKINDCTRVPIYTHRVMCVPAGMCTTYFVPGYGYHYLSMIWTWFECWYIIIHCF